MQSSNLDLIIDETAVRAISDVVNSRSPYKTLQQIMDYHREHTGLDVYVETDDGGGMYLTEIPLSGLAVLEVRFPGKRSIGLYSVSEGNAIADLLMKALGISSSSLH
jgi:hypothetical protein